MLLALPCPVAFPTAALPVSTDDEVVAAVGVSFRAFGLRSCRVPLPEGVLGWCDEFQMVRVAASSMQARHSSGAF